MFVESFDSTSFIFNIIKHGFYAHLSEPKCGIQFLSAMAKKIIKAAEL